MGRVRQAGKNIFFGYISNFIILCMGFLQRTVFIEVLGETLLGVNGLYTDILSMLSLAELGIGSAMNYSLYKPVANGDQEKIKSYMGIYRKAYLAIAGVITVIGLALSPFLPYLIKDSGGIAVVPIGQGQQAVADVMGHAVGIHLADGVGKGGILHIGAHEEIGH